MTNLSSFHAVYHLCFITNISDVPSLQRTLFDANRTIASLPQAPAATYEYSMASYRTMRSLLLKSTPNCFPVAAAARMTLKSGCQT